jgi:hypothetical protein
MLGGNYLFVGRYRQWIFQVTVIGDSPEIAVEGTHRSRGKEPGSWLFGWQILNLTGELLRLIAARFPHGKFKSGEHRFQPWIEIERRGDAKIELPVWCNEAPGSEVENAFLLLEVEWQEVRWRIFVRLRVRVDSSGEPATQTELITTQRIGFSRML